MQCELKAQPLLRVRVMNSQSRIFFHFREPRQPLASFFVRLFPFLPLSPPSAPPFHLCMVIVFTRGPAKTPIGKEGENFTWGTTRRLPQESLGLPPKHLLKPLGPWQLSSQQPSLPQAFISFLASRNLLSCQLSYEFKRCFEKLYSLFSGVLQWGRVFQEM